MIGFFTSTKPGRAKEHNGVLDMFAADAREGLHVLRDNANQATVRAVEESRIFVSQRRDCECGRCAVGWKSSGRNWHFYLRVPEVTVSVVCSLLPFPDSPLFVPCSSALMPLSISMPDGVLHSYPDIQQS